MTQGLMDLQSGKTTTTFTSAASTVNVQAEEDSLDPSIYPFPTRKGNTLSRFRMETSALMNPRVVFLTGATGCLGVHLLSELLHAGVPVIALARAQDDVKAMECLVQNLLKYKLHHHESALDNHLVAVAGDLSKPLLGMDNLRFKLLAIEVDSIIHCGAEVNLVMRQALPILEATKILGNPRNSSIGHQ